MTDLTQPRRARIDPVVKWIPSKTRWVIVYYHPATLKRCFLTTPVAENTKAGRDEAESYMRTQRDKIGVHRQGKGTLATGEQNAVTVNTICDALEKDYTRRRRRSAKSLRSMMLHLRRELGPHRVETLTKSVIIEASDRMEQRGLSDASRNRVMAHLMKAWAVAKDLGIVSRPVDIKIERLKEYSRKGLVSLEELSAVNAAEPWAASRDFNEWAFRTGMRFSEIVSLEWDLFDVRGDVWTMTLDGRHAKNDEDRALPLSPLLRAIISRRLADRQLGCPYVFQHQGQPLSDHGRWEAAWFRAKLPTRETKKGWIGAAKIFHDLRRTAVTNMIEAGIDEKTAMQISGHKTREIFDRYNITSRKRVAAAMVIMDQHVGAVPTQATLPVRHVVRPLTRNRRAGRPGSPAARTASAPQAESA